MNRSPGLHAVVAGAMLLPGALLAQATQPPATPPPWGWPGHGHMWQWYGGWEFPWMGPIMMLLFVVLLCVAVFAIVRWSGGHRHGRPPWPSTGGGEHFTADPAHSAMRILNERFARGEIEKAEYEDKKAVILGSGRS